MALVTDNRLLKIPPGAIENLRKIHNLDKPGRLDEAINILEEWIQKQDHIIKKDFSKEYLEKVIISCKGSVEKAKKQVDRLCTMRTLLPKFFSKTNIKEELQHVADVVWVIPLPELTEDYYRILLIKIKNTNFTSENIMEYFQSNIIITEYLKAHDYINGFIVINDYSELNLLDVVTKLNTVDFQQYTTILTEGYGARVKGVHLLTDSKAVELLVKLVKPFLSPKISNRTHVHKTLNDLHKAIPKEYLPLEYGGKQKSIVELHDILVEEVSSEKHVEYMKMMHKACTDESKRQAGKFNEEYLGMPGSFRALSVD